MSIPSLIIGVEQVIRRIVDEFRANEILILPDKPAATQLGFFILMRCVPSILLVNFEDISLLKVK